MRRTREIWANLIRKFEKSGKTMEEFAAEREIPVGTLKNWIYRIRKAREEEEASILPVRVVTSTAPSARRLEDGSGGVEVMLVRFASSAASDFIADVVTRLRRC